MNAPHLPTAPALLRGNRADCPAWCRDHLDDRANGGADLHQTKLGTAGRVRVDVWQEVGGTMNVELQIPGASTQLLSAGDAEALADLLHRAAECADPDPPSRTAVNPK